MSLVKKARRVDTLDAIVGLTSTAFMLSGSEVLGDAALAMSVAELAFFKAPFVLSYLSQTRDVKALLGWVPKEIAANIIPYGGVIDLMPSYLWRTQYTLKR